VPCLVRALEDARTNGRLNVILLRGTYSLTAPYDPWTRGAVGLPVVTGRVYLVGIGRSAT
jgi:hypothetical protein